MTFYGLHYMQEQSALNDYVKYFFIFASLFVLLIVFSLYMRHRMKTKYRDLSIIALLFLLFVSGVQYADYTQSENRLSQSSQLVNFVQRLAADQQVEEDAVYVNALQLADGVLVAFNDHYYRVSLNADFSAYTLEEAYLTTTDITKIEE
ncbi:DUF3290 domain-containing protein [Enterococcus sp.]|uniref:DUF3290 domain-containing protein n=1 Tax=Enterococcus sp. TaxID=35783 RepID=UPI00289964DC|nr:DUF3290 domain-containing protein [Enterococcus sp.]